MSRRSISFTLILFLTGWFNLVRPALIFAQPPLSKSSLPKIPAYRIETHPIDETHSYDQFFDEEGQLAQERYYENGKLTSRIFFFDLGDWELYRQGEKLVAAGKFEEARPVFEATVKEKPGKSILHFKLGIIYERLKFLYLAKEQYQLAISNGVFDNMARNGLGKVEIMLHEFDDAVHTYQDVLNNDPHDINARYGLAIAYASQKDWVKAKAAVEKVMNADPLYPGAQKLNQDIESQIKAQ